MAIKSEVYKKAEAVNDISLKYHLSHATVACDVLLQETLKENANTKMNDINIKKEAAFKEGDIALFEQLTEEQTRLYEKKRYRIYVDYLDVSDESSARTVCIDNQLVIYLPKKLLEKSMKNGSYTKDVVRLRKLMAHELGHAVLHTSELKEITSTTGSNQFKGTPKEDEANWFADKLLELRHKRNSEMKKDGTLELYF